MTNEAIQDLEEGLPTLKDTFNPSGKAEDLWISIKLVMPKSVATFQPLVQRFEREINMPLEWKNLHQWLDCARRHITKNQTILRYCVTQLGYDIPSPSDLNAESATRAIIETLGRHPVFQVARSKYGPEWFSCREQIIDLSGINILDSNKMIPMEKIRPSIEASATEILGRWRDLQKMKEQGEIDRFREDWAQ